MNAGEAKTAEPHLQQAIVICDEGSTVHAGSFRATLAQIRAQEGAIDEARALIAQAELQAGSTPPPVMGGVLCKKAQVEHIAGDLDVANDALAQARKSALVIGPASSAQLARNIVNVSQMLDNTSASED